MRHTQLTWKARGALWLRLATRLFLALLLIWGIARFGRPLLSLLAPFVAALIAAAVLNPFILWFQRKLGWSRRVLTLLLLLTVLGLLGTALGFLFYFAGQELVALVQNWDALLSRLQSALSHMDSLFASFLSLLPAQMTEAIQSAESALLAWLRESGSAALAGLVSSAGHKAMGVPSFFVALIIFVMATYFLTADYPYMRTRVIQGMNDDIRAFLGQIRSTALGAFGGYLKAQALLSVGVFFILLVGFLVTHQPYSLLLALGLSVLDFIPIVGAGTVMIPWAFVALFTRDYSTAIAIMVIWGIIALFRRVMEPKFVGDQTGLSPILSLLSIYVGMKLAGIPGMILGPILTLVVLNLSGMGMFRGLRSDLSAAFWDISAILSQPPAP